MEECECKQTKFVQLCGIKSQRTHKKGLASSAKPSLQISLLAELALVLISPTNHPVDPYPVPDPHQPPGPAQLI